MSHFHRLAGAVAALWLAGSAATGQAPPPAGPVPQPGGPATPSGALAPGPGGPMIRRMAPPPPQLSGERADVELRLMAGMPTITAMVNGRGPYRFGVDTGAPGYLRISPRLSTALGLQPAGEALTGDPSGRNPVRVSTYQVESLAFGGLTFSAIWTSQLSIPNPALAELDGIIGIGFFESFLLTMDYARGRLTAERGALPESGPGIVPFDLDRGMLITIPVAIGTTAHRVHLDTGNTRQALIFPEAAIASLPTRGPAREAGRARTVSQEFVFQAIALTAPVTVGGTTLPVAEVTWPSPADVGNLGSAALQGLVLQVDQRNRRVRIAPPARR